MQPADRPFDILIFCDMCVDLIVSGEDVVPQFGQVEKLVGDYTIELGGSCGIFACQAARLGLKVAAVGRVGADSFGDLIRRRMAEYGIDLRYVTVDPGIKTGLGIALCQGNDRAILTYMGSINGVLPEMITDDMLASARHLHHGSYYLQHQLRSALPGIFQRAHQLGLTTSLDTNWDPDERWSGGGLEALLRYTDIFMPNEQEALRISRQTDLTSALSALRQAGPPLITIKRGEDGALVDDGKQVVRQAVARVTGGDSIGAGDSFDAGFLSAWLRSMPLAQCLDLACYCGSRVAGAVGGLQGQPDLAQVQARQTGL
ncbi:MAG: carbohydrate kinase family protein [Anaerolineae bacterium]|nr:carbohydrate kinase family protein [Anaerolineae bacterium]